MLCLLNEEFLMRKNNLQREKLKLEVEKLFFLLQVHFPPLEYAKFTARKTRHEVDKVYQLLSLPLTHRKRCFAIVLNDFYGMTLIKTMNRLSSGCERESAVFTFFSLSFITKAGKQNKTHNLSLCFSWSKQRPFKSNLEPTMKHLHVWLHSCLFITISL